MLAFYGINRLIRMAQPLTQNSLTLLKMTFTTKSNGYFIKVAFIFFLDWEF